MSSKDFYLYFDLCANIKYFGFKHKYIKHSSGYLNTLMKRKHKKVVNIFFPFVSFCF